MSYVLRDPLTGAPVLLAAARADRPHDLHDPASDATCPFCPGNESQTPPEIAAERPAGDQAGATGWRVRVFPNKYPVLSPDDGIHEVIVNSPRHVASFGELTDEEASVAVSAWAARLTAAARDRRGLRPFLFLNQGVRGGASLRHTHAQLVGLPFDAPLMAAREAAFACADRCPICADLEGGNARRVALADGLVSWCPKVPPYSGTVRVAPLSHAPDWESDFDGGALGRLLGALVRGFEGAYGDRSLNLWLSQRGPGGSDRFHWYVDLHPRIARMAGLELGVGVVVVSHTPEATAERLRSHL